MKTLAEQIANNCAHFTGIQNDTCKAGIEYRPLVGGDDLGWGTRLPCFKVPFHGEPKGGPRVACESAKFPTLEEAEAEAEESLGRFRARMQNIKDGICPDCQQPVTLRQVGSCVYGSCGHRLYQGKLPKSKAGKPSKGE